MDVTIKKNNPDRLELDVDTPAGRYLFFGILLFIGGVFVLHLLGRTATLTVSNDMVRFEEKRALFGSSSFDIPASQVTDVPVILKESFGKSLTLAVQSAETIYEIPFAFADGDEKRAMAEELKKTIAEPDGTFTHSENPLFLGWTFGIILIGSGLLSFFVIQDISLVMDRQKNIIHIDRKRRFLPKNDQSTIPLSEFKKCQKDDVSLDYGDRRMARASSYYVNIVDQKGGGFSLTRGPMFTEHSAVKTMKLINNWMKQ